MVDILRATEILSPHQDERFGRNSICKKTVHTSKRFIPCYQTIERTSRSTKICMHFLTAIKYFGV